MAARKREIPYFRLWESEADNWGVDSDVLGVAQTIAGPDMSLRWLTSKMAAKIQDGRPRKMRKCHIYAFGNLKRYKGQFRYFQGHWNSCRPWHVAGVMHTYKMAAEIHDGDLESPIEFPDARRNLPNIFVLEMPSLRLFWPSMQILRTVLIFFLNRSNKCSGHWVLPPYWDFEGPDKIENFPERCWGQASLQGLGPGSTLAPPLVARLMI